MTRQVIVIPAEQLRCQAEHRKHCLRVAAYCRVSTDEERQLDSFENQMVHYHRVIEENASYHLVGIYSDEGISGTSIKRRSGFKSMIEDCEAGKIDLVITKSISRFARNTQDSLSYTRRLKDHGVGVYFEKEGINTLESSGELLLTLFSCFAQEESRSISENTSWGIREKFKQGIPHLNVENLLGYDKGPDGRLAINEEQAAIVRRIYRMFLEGFSLGSIAHTLNDEGVVGVRGEARWCATTIGRVLQNEKYKGALLMQKTFTANYLTKQHLPNTGQLEQYYIERNHPPIVEPDEWEATQEEIARRKEFRERHGMRGLSGGGNSPFYARVFCAGCRSKLHRTYPKGAAKALWRCRQCGASLDEEVLRALFCDAFNRVVEHRSSYIERWEQALVSGTPLARLRAKQMLEITAEGPLTFEIPELTQAVLQEAWLDAGELRFVFLSGDELSCQV